MSTWFRLVMPWIWHVKGVGMYDRNAGRGNSGHVWGWAETQGIIDLNCQWSNSFMSLLHVFLWIDYNRVILGLNSCFRELVPLCFCIDYNISVIFSSCGACLEVVCQFEWRTTYVSSQWAVLIFSTTWHTKMSFILNEPIENDLGSNLQTTSKHVPKTYWTWKALYAKQLTWAYPI